jgi:site-specific recombinase XerD
MGLAAVSGNVREAITPARLHNYVKWRKSKGLSEASINRDIKILKHLLTYAVECGFLDLNPIEKFKKLKEELKERQRFTDEQLQAVIAQVRADCIPLFVFIRETGCRREEALSLQHWQIQEESRLVVFSEDTKSKKFRYVPLTDEALQAVNVLPRPKDCPYVFYNPKTQDRWFDCHKPWEESRKQAGIPEIQVKDLRRHFAINLAENGADMHDILQVLGHASVATTEKHSAQFSPRHSAKKILRVLESGKFRNQSTEETKRKQEGMLLRKVRQVKWNKTLKTKLLKWRGRRDSNSRPPA